MAHHSFKIKTDGQSLIETVPLHLSKMIMLTPFSKLQHINKTEQLIYHSQMFNLAEHFLLTFYFATNYYQIITANTLPVNKILTNIFNLI